MSKIRTLLSALAVAGLSATAAFAQQPTQGQPPAPMPTPAEVTPQAEGQLSAPMQDRGATGDATIDEAARQRAAEMEAARLARQRARGPEGELSIPMQDRGGFSGSGDPSGPYAMPQ